MSLIKKAPFSSVLITAILFCSIITGSIVSPLPGNIEKFVAFNPVNFSLLKIYTIFTMIPFAKDGLTVLGLLIIGVGAFIYEYKFKTAKTIVLYLTTHLTSVFSILILSYIKVPLTSTSDVGASIGLWGIAGGVLGYVKYKKMIFATLMLFLIVYIAIRGWDLASIEHPIAFFSGMFYQKLIEYYDKSKK